LHIRIGRPIVEGQIPRHPQRANPWDDFVQGQSTGCEVRFRARPTGHTVPVLARHFGDISSGFRRHGKMPGRLANPSGAGNHLHGRPIGTDPHPSNHEECAGVRIQRPQVKLVARRHVVHIRKGDGDGRIEDDARRLNRHRETWPQFHGTRFWAPVFRDRADRQLPRKGRAIGILRPARWNHDRHMGGRTRQCRRRDWIHRDRRRQIQRRGGDGSRQHIRRIGDQIDRRH